MLNSNKIKAILEKHNKGFIFTVDTLLSGGYALTGESADIDVLPMFLSSEQSTKKFIKAIAINLSKSINGDKS